MKNWNRSLSGRIVALAGLALTLGQGVARAGVVAAQFDFFADGGFTYIQPFYANYILGQTFTPTVSGVLTSVETTIHRSQSTSIPLKFEIRPIRDAGPNGLQPDMQPGATVLATGQMSATDPQFDTFFITFKKVEMSPTSLQAGTLYGLVVSAIGTDQVYQWYTKGNGAGYADGRLFVGYNGDTTLGGQTADVPFRINVETNVFPPTLSGSTNLPNGNFRFSFGNFAGATFTVFASTNPAAPINTWSNLGAAQEISAGKYQFTDVRSNLPRYMFYRVQN